MIKSREELENLSNLYNIDLTNCMSDIDCIVSYVNSHYISNQEKNKITTIMKKAEDVIKRKNFNETTN